MPRCLGGKESEIHISQVTAIVEGDNPPIGQLGGGGEPSEIDKTVAKYKEAYELLTKEAF